MSLPSEGLRKPNFVEIISIGGWDLTTFGFDLDQLAVICILFCIRLPNFVQIGELTAEIWRHIHFSISQLTCYWITKLTYLPVPTIRRMIKQNRIIYLKAHLLTYLLADLFGSCVPWSCAETVTVTYLRVAHSRSSTKVSSTIAVLSVPLIRMTSDVISATGPGQRVLH